MTGKVSHPRRPKKAAHALRPQRQQARRSPRRRSSAAASPATAVRIPLRRYAPGQVEVFLGPTNSGKTHQALAHLARRGAGVYAAPLRMLAYEAYERLRGLIGVGQVGLVTGEERTNAGAPVICCTAEMAPMSAELLVLDEVQWAEDPERGWAWTRLLAGAEVAELYVTGEIGAAPFVQAVLGEDTPITYLERLCPLVVADRTVSLSEVPARSVVVAFSRRAVLHLAGLMRGGGRSVAVLYGALPPEVRRAEVRRFIDGEASVVVATDVIGHGINLPVDSVIFAETSKFDGKVRRRLAAWEVAQIGGRAGRFGLSKAGTVSCLAGAEGFTADPRVVANIDRPSIIVNERPAYRMVNFGYVAPALDDLGVSSPTQLRAALHQWRSLAREELAGLSWARVAPVEPLITRLALLARVRGPWRKAVLSRLNLEDAWNLARAPCDPEDEPDARMLSLLGRRLAGDTSADLAHLLKRPIGDLGAQSLEAFARELVTLRWATLCFLERLDVTHEAVTAKLYEVTDALNAALARAVEHGVAHCISCGRLCAPWFPMCDRCHSKSHVDRRSTFTRSWSSWHPDELGDGGGEEEEDWDEDGGEDEDA